MVFDPTAGGHTSYYPSDRSTNSLTRELRFLAP